MKLSLKDCQKIRISEVVKKAKQEAFKMKLMENIEVLGFPLTTTTSLCHFGGERYWFGCPLCKKRIGVLLVHPISEVVGCRRCLGLR